MKQEHVSLSTSTICVSAGLLEGPGASVCRTCAPVCGDVTSDENGMAHAFNVKVQCKMLKDCVINGASYALAANFRG
jgi:hypothetical protein